MYLQILNDNLKRLISCDKIVTDKKVKSTLIKVHEALILS